MLYFPTLISILEVILVVVPVLLTVAFVTVAERKTMASMQRRLGPNIVGYYGLLQAFADALKLLLKEYVSPTQANIILFFLGPIITLIFSLLGYAVIPYGPGLAIWDFNLGILYMLAVSSLSTYGILLAGWSANSKYAFLGSLRSTAQLISYELILSSAILLVILLTGSLNLTVNIEAQRAIWFIVPLFPIFIIFFIGSVAETNRAPFDLAEAESELVSGFMTEHAAVIFVFFFLAEYASIVLICILTTILFLGGYLFDFSLITSIFYYLFIICDCLFAMLYDVLSGNNFDLGQIIEESSSYYYSNLSNIITLFSNPLIEGMIYGFTLGIKACIMIFVFIWVRASFPRIRFDQLMSFSWTILLPIVIAFIVLVPCIVYGFDIIPCNISLL
jgi:NADH-ubiquinone oxidoreductase chain 1